MVKRLTGSEDPNKPKVLYGVLFEVYRKTDDGTFERTCGYDDLPLTLSSGTATQLPARRAIPIIFWTPTGIPRNMRERGKQWATPSTLGPSRCRR